MTDRPCTVFHSLSYVDAHAAAAFLAAAFGFLDKGIHTDPDDPTCVVHAQMDWPPGGGIMFGSSGRRDDSWADPTGCASCYCVTETDQDVDRVYAQAMAAGATSVLAPADQAYGGRSCTVRDPEGNQWSFGSYRGE